MHHSLGIVAALALTGCMVSSEGPITYTMEPYTFDNLPNYMEVKYKVGCYMVGATDIVDYLGQLYVVEQSLYTEEDRRIFQGLIHEAALNHCEGNYAFNLNEVPDMLTPSQHQDIADVYKTQGVKAGVNALAKASGLTKDQARKIFNDHFVK